MSKVFVVGGGSSLKDFDFQALKNKETIAINYAVFDVPNPKHFITMDYSWFGKMTQKGYKNTFISMPTIKWFVANLTPDSSLKYTNGCYIWREKKTYDLSFVDVTINSYIKKGFGEFNSFGNGLNSGHCAIQLAICLGYTEIYLLGIDYCSNKDVKHYHSHYITDGSFEDKLQIYFDNFYFSYRDYKGKSKIISCSDISRLNDFIPFKKFSSIR